MTEKNQAPTHSYYAFCWEESVLIEKFLRDSDPNHSMGSFGFRDRAEYVAGIAQEEGFGPSSPSARWIFASATENAIAKRAIGSASFQLEPEILASQHVQGDLDTLLTECTPHISLYQKCDCYFTFTEAAGAQVVAQQGAFERLALSPLVQSQYPGKFDEVLHLFDLMRASGSSDYWYLAILCKSSGYPGADENR